MDEEKEMLPRDLEEEAVESEIVEETGKTKAPTWRPQDADREDRKMYTRSRVRNSQIPEGTIFYHAKPKPSISDGGEKAVAVYARVSTKSEEQVSSIENQTRYYKEKIAKNPNWTMQEIYAEMYLATLIQYAGIKLHKNALNKGFRYIYCVRKPLFFCLFISGVLKGVYV